MIIELPPSVRKTCNFAGYSCTSTGRLEITIRPIDPAIVNTTATGTSTIHDALASMSVAATIVSVNPSNGLLEPRRYPDQSDNAATASISVISQAGHS